jgi:hypothetical protein
VLTDTRQALHQGLCKQGALQHHQHCVCGCGTVPACSVGQHTQSPPASSSCSLLSGAAVSSRTSRCASEVRLAPASFTDSCGAAQMQPSRAVCAGNRKP